MICANKDCAKDFDSKTHNQKYCSDECCRVATNKRIMEKYYEKKAIRGGAHRSCKRCSSKLSRYNSSNLCAMCEKNNSILNRSNLKRMIDEVS
jgi:hypothetical protein